MDASTEVATNRYTTAFVTSSDGTTIGYRQLGHGPGVVVLHGAMESAQSHMQLADSVSSSFTVYLPDRRGRGMSGPYVAFSGAPGSVLIAPVQFGPMSRTPGLSAR